jgi:hypothetical protein
LRNYVSKFEYIRFRHIRNNLSVLCIPCIKILEFLKILKYLILEGVTVVLKLKYSPKLCFFEVLKKEV